MTTADHLAEAQRHLTRLERNLIEAAEISDPMRQLQARTHERLVQLRRSIRPARQYAARRRARATSSKDVSPARPDDPQKKDPE